MMKTWGHILNGLCEVLGNDPKVRADVFDQEFTEKKFADILFSLILVSMIRQDYDPSSVLMLDKENVVLKFSHSSCGKILIENEQCSCTHSYV